MKHLLILAALVILAVGCASTPTPAPTVVPTAVPTIVPPTTAPPTATELPPTPTEAPTALPPTNTPIPTTPAPTATNTRPAVTRQPTSAVTTTVGVTGTVTASSTVTASTTITATQPVANKYRAPLLDGPHTGQTYRAGSENLVFSWTPVGPLGTNECYLVSIRVKNMVDNRVAEQSFIAANTCNDPGDSRLVKFTVNKRSPAPNYDGLLADATSVTPGNQFTVTWNVTVIQNNGADPNKPSPTQYVPLSPVSETFDFSLQG